MAQCECLASKFGLRKIVLQTKKSFNLKLRENSDYRRDENIHFQKKFKQLLSEKCTKISIESISLRKRNLHSNVSQTVCRGRFVRVPWCAASLFKALCTDTSFSAKIEKMLP